MSKQFENPSNDIEGKVTGRSPSLEIAMVASGDPNLDTFDRIESGGTGPIWQLSQRFVQRGHTVTVYGGTHTERNSQRLSGVEIINKSIPNLDHRVDMLLNYTPFLRRLIHNDEFSTTPGEMIERLFARLLFSWKVARSLSSTEPDVVYSRDRISAFFPTRTAIPAVYTVSSPDACDFMKTKAVKRHNINRVLYRYKQLIEHFVLTHSDSSIVMNKRIKSYFETKGFGNMSLITLGVQESEFVDLQNRKEKPEVLYVGRLDGNKRPDWLLDAFLELDQQNFSLHFVGSGLRMKVLEKRAERSDRSSEITIHGQIPREDVLSYMRRAAVLVLPSEFESCPNVIVEAMASGCPVIASDTMGAHELITDGETGLLFDKNNKEDLQECLGELLNNKRQRRDLAVSAYRYAKENHTADIIADKYLSIGRAAIQNHG